MEQMDGVYDEEVEEDSSDSSSDEDDSMEEEENENEENAEAKKVYLPGNKMEEGEKLVVDESAYRILHQAQTGAPCLSFDIINDELGNSRETYPLTMYLLAGTQAPRAHVNNLLVMKMSNLHGTKTEDDSEEESSDSEDEENSKSATMSVASIKHQGCVNRVRSVTYFHKTQSSNSYLSY